ncbi:MAG: DNA polymerase IV [Neomegalonema sp.]|nr:DNA polymerase IV [Neomegalonema sp.]
MGGGDEIGGPCLCRDCGWRVEKFAGERCPDCRSPRLIAHVELFALTIAHVDCDAFYASVEKRDRPELRDKPVIVGGGQRGVVSTACYLARAYGVRSAMPARRAAELCPQAVFVKPDMAKYREAAAEIRARFDMVTPAVEPLSLDEAFLDLAGLERLHKAPPAALLGDLARRIEAEVGVTVSIGLAPNKFLAKIASELDKPRGFAVIGAREAVGFLEDKPVSIIWGVGPRFSQKLIGDGFRTVGDLRRAEPKALAGRYGAIGLRLAQLARAEDARAVVSRRGAKSISSETTFPEDIADQERLQGLLWRRCEALSRRLKEKALVCGGVALILKTADFQRLSRRRTLEAPTASAERLYQATEPLLRRETAGGRAFRLLGVGALALGSAEEGGGERDLFGAPERDVFKAEEAIDAIRAKFGDSSILKGRALKARGSTSDD